MNSFFTLQEIPGTIFEEPQPRRQATMIRSYHVIYLLTLSGKKLVRYRRSHSLAGRKHVFPLKRSLPTTLPAATSTSCLTVSVPSTTSLPILVSL